MDESGFAELIALRDIEPDEELLLGYDLRETRNNQGIYWKQSIYCAPAE